MGVSVPSKPDPVPVEPYSDLVWAWNGFWRLSNTRPVGFDGALRIPLSEIEAYARLQGFDHAKRNEFLIYVERMDATFMEHVAKLREEEERKRKNKSNERGRPPRRRR